MSAALEIAAVFRDGEAAFFARYGRTLRSEQRQALSRCLICFAPMDSRRDSLLKIAVVAAAVAVLPLTLYAVAYFSLTLQTTPNLHSGGTCRVYRSMWQAIAFMPAAAVESTATGEEVSAAWREVRR